MSLMVVTSKLPPRRAGFFSSPADTTAVSDKSTRREAKCPGFMMASHGAGTDRTTKDYYLRLSPRFHKTCRRETREKVAQATASTAQSVHRPLPFNLPAAVGGTDVPDQDNLAAYVIAAGAPVCAENTNHADAAAPVGFQPRTNPGHPPPLP